jgi:outer membrane protein insertion porin family
MITNKMNQRRFLPCYFFLAFICLLGNSSCVGGRRWPEGKALYTGAKFKIKKQGNKASLSEVKSKAKEIIATPKPNRRFLGFRAGVWRYTHTRQDSWIQRRLSHTPVYYSATQVKQTELALLNCAKHTGWLDAKVTSNVKWDKKKLRAKVKYRIELGGNPYKIGSFTMPQGQSPVDSLLRQLNTKTILPKPNKVYQLDQIVAARQALVKEAKNQGFYFLSSDHLVFHADTNRSTKQIDFRLALKPETPAAAKIPWRIGQMDLYPDYKLQQATAKTQTTEAEGIRIHQVSETVLHQETLLKSISLRVGDIYTEAAHSNTLAQLHNLRVYALINLRFEPIDSTGELRCMIYLTPQLPQTIEVGLSAVAANDLYYGGETGIRYINRNMFKGAELLQVKPTYSYLYLTGEDEGSRLQTFDLNVGLQRPFLLRKKNRKKPLSLYTLTIDGNYQSSLISFPDEDPDLSFKVGLNEVKAEAGFIRKPTRNTYWSQEIKPLSGTYQFTRFRPGELDDAIKESIKEDTSLLIFAPQLSYAPRMVIAYDSRFREGGRSSHYFRQMFRFKYGSYLLSDATKEAIGYNSLVQLASETDARIYHKVGPRLIAAGRIVANFALPIGNSTALGFPLSDLYSAGGSNGLRTFALRSLGPGTYTSEGDTSLVAFSRQTGNMLLQFSAELRYRRKNLETAVFTDVGNTWNTYTSDVYPGGEFHWSEFYKQLGLGAGLGFRYYYSLLVFRLDVGYALHDPSQPSGSRWAEEFELGKLRFAFAFGQAF